MYVPITIKEALAAIGGSMYKSNLVDYNILLPVLDSKVLSLSLDEAFSLYLGGFYKESSIITDRITRVLMFISYNLLKWEEYDKLNAPCVDCEHSTALLDKINTKYKVKDLLNCIDCKGFDKTKLDRFAQSLVPILPTKAKMPMTVNQSAVGNSCIAKPDGTADCNCTKIPITCEQEDIMICDGSVATVEFDIPLNALGNTITIERTLPFEVEVTDNIEFTVDTDSIYNGALAIAAYINSLDNPIIRASSQDTKLILYYKKNLIVDQYSGYTYLCSSQVQFGIPNVSYYTNSLFDCCVPLCASCCEDSGYSPTPRTGGPCPAITFTNVRHNLSIDAIDCEKCRECCSECDQLMVCTGGSTESGYMQGMSSFTAHMASRSNSNCIYGGAFPFLANQNYTADELYTATLQIMGLSPAYSHVCYKTSFHVLSYELNPLNNSQKYIKALAIRILPTYDCDRTYWAVMYLDTGSLVIETYWIQGYYSMYPEIVLNPGSATVIFPTSGVQQYNICPEKVDCDHKDNTEIIQLDISWSIGICEGGTEFTITLTNVDPNIVSIKDSAGLDLLTIVGAPIATTIPVDETIQDFLCALKVEVNKCTFYDKLFDIVVLTKCNGIDIASYSTAYSRYRTPECLPMDTHISCPECIDSTVGCDDCCPPPIDVNCAMCADCCNTTEGCSIPISIISEVNSCNDTVNMDIVSTLMVNPNQYNIIVQSPDQLILYNQSVSLLYALGIEGLPYHPYYIVTVWELTQTSADSCTITVYPTASTEVITPICGATVVNNECGQTSSGSITLTTTAVIQSVVWTRLNGDTWEPVVCSGNCRSITSQPSGLYHAVITYSDGCIGNCDFEITGINSPIITLVTPANLCISGGNAIVSVVGGDRSCIECTQGLWISVNGGEYVQLDSTNMYIMENVTVGQYLIKVKDCSCCIATKTITINQNSIR